MREKLIAMQLIIVASGCLAGAVTYGMAREVGGFGILTSLGLSIVPLIFIETAFLVGLRWAIHEPDREHTPGCTEGKHG